MVGDTSVQAQVPSHVGTWEDRACSAHPYAFLGPGSVLREREEREERERLIWRCLLGSFTIILFTSRLGHHKDWISERPSIFYRCTTGFAFENCSHSERERERGAMCFTMVDSFLTVKLSSNGVAVTKNHEEKKSVIFYLLPFLHSRFQVEFTVNKSLGDVLKDMR